MEAQDLDGAAEVSMPAMCQPSASVTPSAQRCMAPACSFRVWLRRSKASLNHAA